MPGLITHFICGEAVYKALDPSVQHQIDRHREIYNVGTQGPDIFFYYVPGLLKKNTMDLGTRLHTSNINQFFGALLDAFEHTHDQQGKDALFVYLLGYLTHYCLDCAAHPYIYYKSGFREKGAGLKNFIYSMNHRNFETAIDVLMLKFATSRKPSDKKIWHMIQVDKKTCGKLSRMVQKAIHTTYNVPLSDGYVCSAILYMMNFTRFFQSKHGRKKKVLELIEDVTFSDRFFSSLIHPNELKDDIDYLNLNKSHWYKPWDNSQKVEASFIDLFNEAKEEAVFMIHAAIQYYDQQLSKENLLKIIGNRSLSSGAASDDTSVVFRYKEIAFKHKKKNLHHRQSV